MKHEARGGCVWMGGYPRGWHSHLTSRPYVRELFSKKPTLGDPGSNAQISMKSPDSESARRDDHEYEPFQFFFPTVKRLFFRGSMGADDTEREWHNTGSST